MSMANAWPVVERVFCVTARAMSGEMELRNEEFQRKPVLGELKFLRIVLYPLTKLYGPTACDIIGYLDNLDLFIFHGR